MLQDGRIDIERSSDPGRKARTDVSVPKIQIRPGSSSGRRKVRDRRIGDLAVALSLRVALLS